MSPYAAVIFFLIKRRRIQTMRPIMYTPEENNSDTGFLLATVRLSLFRQFPAKSLPDRSMAIVDLKGLRGNGTAPIFVCVPSSHGCFPVALYPEAWFSRWTTANSISGETVKE